MSLQKYTDKYCTIICFLQRLSSKIRKSVKLKFKYVNIRIDISPLRGGWKARGCTCDKIPLFLANNSKRVGGFQFTSDSPTMAEQNS